jgi:hypothetical protein
MVLYDILYYFLFPEVECFNFKELHFNEASFLIIVRFQLN